jgi:hypothetical protein
VARLPSRWQRRHAENPPGKNEKRKASFVEVGEYNFVAMRFCAYTVLFLSCFFAEGPQSTPTFPIPDMQEIWPGAKLDDAENQLLKKAVESDLHGIEKYCDQQRPFESVDSADLDLEKLGRGVLVLMTGSRVCGVTSGCPSTHMFAKRKDIGECSAAKGEIPLAGRLPW